MQKNKFIYLIISIIIIIFIGTFISIFFRGIDRNSYLELISGKVSLNETELNIGERKKVFKNDLIETKTSDSLAIIEWGDGSITRIGGNTKVEILENNISKNKKDINILFKLSSGKTWSNVISYIGEDSYFKQVFNDSEAAVRGTIFTVDLDKNYLQVESHKVDIKDKNYGNFEVFENKQLKLTDFKFISLDDFINYFKDKEFFEINKKLDKEYFLKLLKNLEKDFDNFVSYSLKEIDNLTKEEREKVYLEFMEKYQELNFVSADISEKFFNLKINLKEKLIDLTPESGKEYIIKTLNYDLKDIFDNKNFYSFEKILNILKENEKYIDKNQLKDFFEIFNIKFDFRKTINESIDTLKENVFNNPEYQKFMKTIGDEFNIAIKNQKSFFKEFIDWVKNLFN